MDAQLINGQIRNFAYKLEKSLSEYSYGQIPNDTFEVKLFNLIEKSSVYNPWFIPGHMVYALKYFATELHILANTEKIIKRIDEKKIGVLFRTNSPLEGITNLIYIVLNGYTVLVQTLPELKKHIEDLIELLAEIPEVTDRIELIEDKFSNIIAIIALAPLSVTSLQYFSKYPILQIYNEGLSDILINISDNTDMLSESCCMYFGRSSMNVKVLFVPREFDVAKLAIIFNKYSDQLNHNRYYNNYEYRKSVMIINRIPYMETGPLLITEDENQAGYIGVLLLKRYDMISSIDEDLITRRFPVKKTETANFSTFIRHQPLIKSFLDSL